MALSHRWPGKEDVEIPLVETLELIPEPDGSTTEDFVIPEWLEKLQQQKRGAREVGGALEFLHGDRWIMLEKAPPRPPPRRGSAAPKDNG